MQIRLLLGPAGSGKTFRCLREIADDLGSSVEGTPLMLLAPKQATYQLERQLLSLPGVEGYTRLQVLSLERLARAVFPTLGLQTPNVLDEEGRLMVLRSVLARVGGKLKLFRASARLAGFAQELSLALHELKQSLATPELLEAIADKCPRDAALAGKLRDLALVMREYEAWLDGRGLKDSDYLITSAADALRSPAAEKFRVAGLWVDGFGEWSAGELDLLMALVARAERTTITFCLDSLPAEKGHWLSHWSSVRLAYEACRTACASLPGADCRLEILPRLESQSRYSRCAALATLERDWSSIMPASSALQPQAVRLVECQDGPAEVRYAARQIRRYVREGGRYRDVMLLARALEPYHEEIHRVFALFGIPFFLDRRESMSHHPLIELTRSALRVAAFEWRHDDLFSVLKCGVAGMAQDDVDRLENAALEHGWEGEGWADWADPGKDVDLGRALARFRKMVVPVLSRFHLALKSTAKPVTGVRLAELLRQLWRGLEVERQLQDKAAADNAAAPEAVHATVWTQANTWLTNLEMAFPEEAMTLRDWLTITEAGLSALTVGLIPPALDQVLVGTVERSRNPEARLTIVLGCNEGVFPAKPPSPALFTEADREELERFQMRAGATLRRHLAREQHLVYTACTRATEQLLLVWRKADDKGGPMNPSPFIAQVRRIFPAAPVEVFVQEKLPIEDCEHGSELLYRVLSDWPSRDVRDLPAALAEVPVLAESAQLISRFARSNAQHFLSPKLAQLLYGRTLKTSVSRLEQFAACPFKFFLHSGLRAEERRIFEVDAREEGSFQHDVLARFHKDLAEEGRRWRDLTVPEARERVARCAEKVVNGYREGLFDTSHKTRFVAKLLVTSLQEFVGTIVEWMRGQYLFEPAHVELSFGGNELPAFQVPVEGGRSLELHGRIDRVDIFREDAAGDAKFVVIDYKSSEKEISNVLLDSGLQLQLLAYTAVLRRSAQPNQVIDSQQLTPVGAFYVSLKGKLPPGESRAMALGQSSATRKQAYRHSGRFNAQALPLLDASGQFQGDQFNYRLKNSREFYRNCAEPLPEEDFHALLDRVEAMLKNMGERIYSGEIGISPFKHGPRTACGECDFGSVCRVDPWTHPWRLLKKGHAEGLASDGSQGNTALEQPFG